MMMKIVGALALLLGLLMLVFAVMAYSELNAAATSETPPPVESMRLTKIVAPELFDQDNASAKPATLARIAFGRIYMIGGGSLVLAMAGVLVLVLGKSRKQPQTES